MAPKKEEEDGGVGTPEPVEKGFATLQTLSTGVKAMVQKDGELRKAEILSKMTRKGTLHFYVHYVEFNKRLDEWISAERIDLSKEVEWPAPEKTDKKKTGPQAARTDGNKSQKNKQKLPTKLERGISGTPEATSVNLPGKAPRPSRAGGKENREIVSTPDGGDTPLPDDDEVMVDVDDAAVQAQAGTQLEDYTVEEEREKLRTGGSMTQNQAEISRVRNLNRIQMGKHEIDPWYFSPYPQEFNDVDLVYIDEFCLGYFGELKQFERHRMKCQLQHPPGNEIYRDDRYSFFEVDGRRQRTWCRNLCLLSKLFLDHKTLYYDVDPFLFYCMCTRDEYGCHLVGYFSKEKDSADGYNVACILTLPQHQRKGFGRVLIAFSYELSKREGKYGSPEKPLSDLGLLSYRKYWQEEILDIIFDGRKDISIEDVQNQLAMIQTDVVHALDTLKMIRYHKNQYVIFVPEAVKQQYEKQKEKEKLKPRHKIDPEKLIWRPPVFTASSRTWNCSKAVAYFQAGITSKTWTPEHNCLWATRRSCSAIAILLLPMVAVLLHECRRYMPYD